MQTQSSNPNPNPNPRNKRRFLFGSIAAGVLVLVAGNALVYAHGMRGMHGGMEFGELSEQFQVHVEHVIKEVNATPEQQVQIKSIVEAASNDLQSLHAQHGSVHAQLHEILTAPAIDRARLEALRAEHIQAMDAASKRCLTALADAAEVLTPEQRAQLGEKMSRKMVKDHH